MMCFGGVDVMRDCFVAGFVFGVTAGVGAVLVFDSDTFHGGRRDNGE